MILIVNYSVVQTCVLGAAHQFRSIATCLPVPYSTFLCRPVFSIIFLRFVGQRNRMTSRTLRLVVKLMKLALKYHVLYNHVTFHRSRTTW